MQDIMADSFEDAAGTSLHHLPAKPLPAVPLMDDPNDDFCRVCGYGVGCPFISQLPECCICPGAEGSFVLCHVGHPMDHNPNLDF